jgi:hypothetical protein
VVAFLIGCVVLLGVGCAATRSETSNKKEQGRSPEATESEEEARCQGTMTYHSYTIFYRKGGMVDKTGSEEDMKKAAKKARHLATAFTIMIEPTSGSRRVRRSYRRPRS